MPSAEESAAELAFGANLGLFPVAFGLTSTSSLPPLSDSEVVGYARGDPPVFFRAAWLVLVVFLFPRTLFSLAGFLPWELLCEESVDLRLLEFAVGPVELSSMSDTALFLVLVKLRRVCVERDAGSLSLSTSLSVSAAVVGWYRLRGTKTAQENSKSGGS